MTTEDAIALLYDLKRDRSSGHEKPHKPVLLLAVMDLIERGEITDNEIIPSKELREAFTTYFKIVQQGNDQNTPEIRFTHSQVRVSGLSHPIDPLAHPRVGPRHNVKSLTPASAKISTR